MKIFRFHNVKIKPKLKLTNLEIICSIEGSPQVYMVDSNIFNDNLVNENMTTVFLSQDKDVKIQVKCVCC